MKFYRLTHESFLLYAIKCYENPAASTADEFKRDMKHFAYISKFLNKASGEKAPKYRLLLNHIIILLNLFGAVPTARMIFFYFPERHFPVLKAALAKLGALPDKIPEVDLSAITADPEFAEFLEKL